MQHRFHLVLLFLVLMACTTSSFPQAPRTQAQAANVRIALPLVNVPGPPNPFGFDLRTYSSNEILQYGAATRPKWARAGDVFWSQVEATKGTYDWSALAGFENNVRRLRAAGIEPLGIIQQSPAWAQSIPGRLCSPPTPEHLDAFIAFVYNLVSRYANGPTAVHHWELWNEPDTRAADSTDSSGIGCWLDTSKPDRGGAYYGEMLKRSYPVIKFASPAAVVLAGGLLYDNLQPNNSSNDSALFLDGILSSGAGNSFDGLSFHAYGEYGPSSLLLIKVQRIREQLAKYGLQNKLLYATEIADICSGDAQTQCAPDYNSWLLKQANFAARIYAEALALKLEGAFWFMLSAPNPGFRFSHLIDEGANGLQPRPAYYAFRNSSVLLQGVRYIGPPMKELTDAQLEEVQELKFRKSRSTVYVLWVPRLDFPKLSYKIYVPPGSTAICTQSLHLETPSRYYCSDTNNDGVIPLGIGPLPYYVEVLDQ